jgi:hypothetical protein
MVKAFIIFIVFIALFLVDFSQIDSNVISDQIGQLGNFIVSKFS